MTQVSSGENDKKETVVMKRQFLFFTLEKIAVNIIQNLKIN